MGLCEAMEKGEILVKEKEGMSAPAFNADDAGKVARNSEYLAMIDAGIAQLEAGGGQLHELEEIEEEWV